MRVVFMGTPDFAVPTLEALTTKHEIIAVVTQPDKPRGRGKAMQFPPVKRAALAHGLPVCQPARVRDPEFLDTLRSLDPDVIIVAAFGQILPESIIDLPRYGCINVHASLLPKYRGAAPIQWAIINGEKETGVTIMYMEKGLDTGDMIARASVPIDPRETGESLHDKLSLLGGPLILEVLDQIGKGIIHREKQDDSLSTYAGMLSKELGRIDWEKDAASIERLIRGLNSWPSAYTFLGERTLKIWMAEVTEGKKEMIPGTVIGTDKDSFTVQTGKGGLRILEVQLQGKKRMPVQAFLLGYPVKTGMTLGE